MTMGKVKVLKQQLLLENLQHYKMSNEDFSKKTGSVHMSLEIRTEVARLGVDDVQLNVPKNCAKMDPNW